MKLHLPLPLRFALLAVCSLIATTLAETETLTEDFVFTGGSGLVHRNVSEFSYNGNNRQYSYTAAPTGDGVYWMQAAEAKVTMTGMKKIDIQNLHGVYGQRKSASSYSGSTYYVASTDVDISDSDFFNFSNNHAEEWNLEIPYTAPRYFQGTRICKISWATPSASLSAGGNVSISNVGKIVFEGNEGAVMRGGSLTIKEADSVLFANHTDIIFDRNEGVDFSVSYYGTPSYSHTSSYATKALFESIKNLTFKDNAASIFVTAGTAPQFTNCETILFENTVGLGLSSEFTNCTSVTFNNTNLVSSTFTDCDTIEIKNIKSGNAGDNPTFNNVSKGLYIKDNEGLFSTGFTSSGSADKLAELVISGNKGSAGTWSADSFKKVEVANNETASDIAIISSAKDIGAITITGNRVIASSELRDVIRISSAENVDSIVISDNVVQAPSNKYDTGIISITEGKEIGSLEISNNVIGCKLENDGWVIADTSKSFDDVFGRSNVSGRTEGKLSSTVVIKDNIMGSISSSHKNAFSLSNLLSLEVANNEVKSQTIHTSWFADLKLSNISRVKFDDNRGFIRISALDLQGSESFTYTNNETLILGFTHYTGYNGNGWDEPHTINAKTVTISDNYGYGKGGAIYESVKSSEIMVFEGCGTVTIQGNKVSSDTIGEAAGAFIYANEKNAPLIFRDNDKVLIRGNYITDGTSAQLNAIYIASNLDLQVKAGQTIEVYDGMHIGGVLNINESLEGEEIRSGSITISGVHAEADLKKLGFTPTAEDVAASRLVEVGEMHVYGGRLSLDEITLNSSNDIASEAATTINVKNTTLRSAKGIISLSSASFTGQNSISSSSIIASNGSWIFNMGAANSSTAVVHVDFNGAENKFTTKGQQFSVVYDDNLMPGRYKLLDFNSYIGSWDGADTVSLKGVDAAVIDLPGYGEVYYTIKGDTYTLWFDYNGALYKGEMPSLRASTALLWSKNSGIWKEASGVDVWSGVVEDRNFYKGDIAVFRSESTVTIEGDVQPEDILVSLDKGKVTFNSKDGGKIEGSASITKLGEGELVLNLANAYTGYVYGERTVGTVLKGGKITVGNVNALGKGAVLIQSGALDLSGLAVGNDIAISAETATLNGAELYAGKFTLESGDVSGEQDSVIHLAQDAELISGSLSHNLSGTGAVVKTGAGMVTLTGKKIESTGGITVNGGTLVLNGVTCTGDSAVNKGTLSFVKAVYAGDIVVENGATLSVRSSIVSGNFDIKFGASAKVDGLQLMKNDSLRLAGSMEGGVNISGGTMNIVGKRILGGNLTLDGGVMTITSGGSLQVDGNLSATSPTELYVNVHELPNGKNDLIFMLGKNDLDIDNIVMPEIRGSKATLSADNTRINQKDNTWYWCVCLTLNSRTLAWIKDVTNEWGLQLEGKRWLTTSDDKRFFNLDYVIFENAGEVNIVSEVNPGKITVKGEEDTTFSGEGSITGKAELIKEGGGTLKIATDNKEYGGVVNVNEGTLLASHSNALGQAEVRVNIGATFSVADGCRIRDARVIFNGTSTINDAKGATAMVEFASASEVSGSYTLSKENTLTIGALGAAFTGNFTFAGGTLKLQNNEEGAAAGIFDLVNGKVSFTSGCITTIDISDCQGLELGEQYTLISLAPVKDMESYFTLEGAEGEIYYDENTNSLVLTLTETENDPAGGENKPGGEENTEPGLGGDSEDTDKGENVIPVEPANPVLSKNQNATLKALEAAVNDGLLTGELANLAAEVLAGAAENPRMVAELLDKLSGAELATAMTSQLVGNLAHLRRLRANMGCGYSVDSTGKNAFYLVGFDEQHSVDENEDGRGIKRTEWGGMVGYERSVGEKTLLGVALSSGSADVKPTNAEGYTEEATRADIYFIANFGSAWQSVTSIGYGVHSFDTTRHLPNAMSAKASMDGTSINFMQELSYTIRTSESNSWQPFAAVELSANSIDAFTESGAGTASLAGGSRSATAADITLGARYIHTFAMGGRQGSVHAQAGVVASAGDTAADLELHFTGAPGQKYTVSSAGYDGVGFNIGGGIELPVSKSASVTGSLNAILRSGAEEYGASVGVRIRF